MPKLAGFCRGAMVAALCTTTLLSACGGGGASIDEDADLVVYSGRSQKLVGPLIERFERESKLDVSVRYGDSSELAAVLREEGDKSPADLFWAQDAGSLDSLDGAKLLKAQPGVGSEVPAKFRAASGAWVGTSARARVIAYDSRVLGPQQLPKSVFGLTDPKWKGKVGWAPSNASFQAFITAMRATEGEARTRSWIEAMVANGTQRLENNIAIRDAIARGELQAGLINHYYVAEAKAEDPNYPVGVFSPAGDIGAMVNVAGVGLLASADGAPAAKRFTEFVLADEAQKFFVDNLKEYAVRGGFPTPTGVTPLDKIEQPRVDLNALGDQQGTVELLQDAGVL